MKKFFAILLAFTLILALAACGETQAPAPEPTPVPTTEPTPEPTPPPTVETWYGRSHGVELRLELSSDGAYTLTLGKETRSGTWAQKDGGIVLDGDGAAPLYRVDGKLRWQGTGLFLYAEKTGVSAYVPADVLSDGVTAEAFNGYWKSLYVNVDGMILSALELSDKTDVCIEAVVPQAEAETADADAPTPEPSAPAAADTAKVALGGPLFADTAVEMRFKDGALSYTADALSVKLELQADDLLRMTLSASDADMVLYLAPAYVEGLSPKPTEG